MGLLSPKNTTRTTAHLLPTVTALAVFSVTAIFLYKLLKRYPGMVPDVDMMFDCMDKPRINTTEHRSMPLPLFRYCTTEDHSDIPFPDWSFWGWPETNLRPWDEEFRDIKRGSQRISWSRKDWAARIGYGKSKLSNQCDYKYKIYAEGYAWSVSLKYILSCGSLALIITPDYEDFFSRGLIPLKNYWPVSSNNICPSIKYAVDWGNGHSSEAKAIGKEGQKLMETLSTDSVYDYMFHLIAEYSKLQDFKPVPPSSAKQLCSDSLLCIADYEQRQYLQQSTAFPSQAPPCTLLPADRNVIKSWKQQKKKIIKDVEDMEKVKAQRRSK
ncbi:O-glucosyltransferase rumi [Morella rubra]|uniref:O-glucosyltransferase rumi n=1 Tax=Morella rubra TaxID=262757 RepID=A0A6A1WKK0_9ROSI|nr:O-glucosyltransferase rumi [Morella rubra]